MTGIRLVKKADAEKAFTLVWKDAPEKVELRGDSESAVKGWVREFKAIAAARNAKRDFERLFSAAA